MCRLKTRPCYVALYAHLRIAGRGLWRYELVDIKLCFVSGDDFY